MRTLVLGGIRSGKSDWAESALHQAGAVRYLATAAGRTDDAAWARRIADHQDRRPSGWLTVETAEIADQLRADPDSPTLVDDLGGWLTAVLDRHGWDPEPITADVDDLVDAVNRVRGELVLVSPEVGLAVVPATASGRRFTDELGVLNRRLADCCQQVVLVIAGQPVWIKGPGV